MTRAHARNPARSTAFALWRLAVANPREAPRFALWRLAVANPRENTAFRIVAVRGRKPARKHRVSHCGGVALRKNHASHCGGVALRKNHASHCGGSRSRPSTRFIQFWNAREAESATPVYKERVCR